VALAAALTIAPGLLENWLTTGNPVYPFVFSNGIYWDAWRGWWYDRPGTGLAGEAPWRLLTAPLEATILGTEGTILYDATIGPLLFASLFLLPMVWSRIDEEERAVIGHMLLVVGVNYVLWLVGLARTALLLQTRMLFLIFGPAAVVGAVALQRLGSLDRPQLRISWLARAVVSLTLALLLVSHIVQFLQINPLPVVLGLETRDDYLTRRLGWYYVMVQDLNRELPAGSVVLFLWEPRSYHCGVTCWPDALLDRFLHTTHIHGHDAGAIAAEWRGAGVTHVLLGRAGMESVVEDGFDPITPQDLAVLDELTARYLLPVDAWHQVYELYELSQ
jgi:hypothetical protein